MFKTLKTFKYVTQILKNVQNVDKNTKYH